MEQFQFYFKETQKELLWSQDGIPAGLRTIIGTSGSNQKPHLDRKCKATASQPSGEVETVKASNSVLNPLAKEFIPKEREKEVLADISNTCKVRLHTEKFEVITGGGNVEDYDTNGRIYFKRNEGGGLDALKRGEVLLYRGQTIWYPISKSTDHQRILHSHASKLRREVVKREQRPTLKGASYSSPYNVERKKKEGLLRSTPVPATPMRTHQEKKGGGKVLKPSNPYTLLHHKNVEAGFIETTDTGNTKIPRWVKKYRQAINRYVSNIDEPLFCHLSKMKGIKRKLKKLAELGHGIEPWCPKVSLKHETLTWVRAQQGDRCGVSKKGGIIVARSGDKVGILKNKNAAYNLSEYQWHASTWSHEEERFKVMMKARMRTAKLESIVVLAMGETGNRGANVSWSEKPATIVFCPRPISKPRGCTCILIGPWVGTINRRIPYSPITLADENCRCKQSIHNPRQLQWKALRKYITSDKLSEHAMNIMRSLFCRSITDGIPIPTWAFANTVADQVCRDMWESPCPTLIEDENEGVVRFYDNRYRALYSGLSEGCQGCEVFNMLAANVADHKGVVVRSQVTTVGGHTLFGTLSNVVYYQNGKPIIDYKEWPVKGDCETKAVNGIFLSFNPPMLKGYSKVFTLNLDLEATQHCDVDEMKSAVKECRVAFRIASTCGQLCILMPGEKYVYVMIPSGARVVSGDHVDIWVDPCSDTNKQTIDRVPRGEHTLAFNKESEPGEPKGQEVIRNAPTAIQLGAERGRASSSRRGRPNPPSRKTGTVNTTEPGRKTLQATLVYQGKKYRVVEDGEPRNRKSTNKAYYRDTSLAEAFKGLEVKEGFRRIHTSVDATKKGVDLGKQEKEQPHKGTGGSVASPVLFNSTAAVLYTLLLLLILFQTPCAYGYKLVKDHAYCSNWTTRGNIATVSNCLPPCLPEGSTIHTTTEIHLGRAYTPIERLKHLLGNHEVKDEVLLTALIMGELGLGDIAVATLALAELWIIEPVTISNHTCDTRQLNITMSIAVSSLEPNWVYVAGTWSAFKPGWWPYMSKLETVFEEVSELIEWAKEFCGVVKEILEGKRFTAIIIVGFVASQRGFLSLIIWCLILGGTDAHTHNPKGSGELPHLCDVEVHTELEDMLWLIGERNNFSQAAPFVNAIYYEGGNVTPYPTVDYCLNIINKPNVKPHFTIECPYSHKDGFMGTGAKPSQKPTGTECKMKNPWKGSVYLEEPIQTRETKYVSCPDKPVPHKDFFWSVCNKDSHSKYGPTMYTLEYLEVDPVKPLLDCCCMIITKPDVRPHRNIKCEYACDAGFMGTGGLVSEYPIGVECHMKYPWEGVVYLNGPIKAYETDYVECKYKRTVDPGYMPDENGAGESLTHSLFLAMTISFLAWMLPARGVVLPLLLCLVGPGETQTLKEGQIEFHNYTLTRDELRWQVCLKPYTSQSCTTEAYQLKYVGRNESGKIPIQVTCCHKIVIMGDKYPDLQSAEMSCRYNCDEGFMGYGFNISNRTGFRCNVHYPWEGVVYLDITRSASNDTRLLPCTPSTEKSLDFGEGNDDSATFEWATPPEGYMYDRKDPYFMQYLLWRGKQYWTGIARRTHELNLEWLLICILLIQVKAYACLLCYLLWTQFGQTSAIPCEIFYMKNASDVMQGEEWATIFTWLIVFMCVGKGCRKLVTIMCLIFKSRWTAILVLVSCTVAGAEALNCNVSNGTYIMCLPAAKEEYRHWNISTGLFVLAVGYIIGAIEKLPSRNPYLERRAEEDVNTTCDRRLLLSSLPTSGSLHKGAVLAKMFCYPLSFALMVIGIEFVIDTSYVKTPGAVGDNCYLLVSLALTLTLSNVREGSWKDKWLGKCKAEFATLASWVYFMHSIPYLVACRVGKTLSLLITSISTGCKPQIKEIRRTLRGRYFEIEYHQKMTSVNKIYKGKVEGPTFEKGVMNVVYVVHQDLKGKIMKVGMSYMSKKEGKGLGTCTIHPEAFGSIITEAHGSTGHLITLVCRNEALIWATYVLFLGFGFWGTWYWLAMAEILVNMVSRHLTIRDYSRPDTRGAILKRVQKVVDMILDLLPLEHQTSYPAYSHESVPTRFYDVKTRAAYLILHPLRVARKHLMKVKEDSLWWRNRMYTGDHILLNRQFVNTSFRDEVEETVLRPGNCGLNQGLGPIIGSTRRGLVIYGHLGISTDAMREICTHIYGGGKIPRVTLESNNKMSMYEKLLCLVGKKPFINPITTHQDSSLSLYKIRKGYKTGWAYSRKGGYSSVNHVVGSAPLMIKTEGHGEAIHPTRVDVETDTVEYGDLEPKEAANGLLGFIYNPEVSNVQNTKGAVVLVRKEREGWQPISSNGIPLEYSLTELKGWSGLPIMGCLDGEIYSRVKSAYKPENEMMRLTEVITPTMATPVKMKSTVETITAMARGDYTVVNLATGAGKSTELPYLVSQHSNCKSGILVLIPLVAACNGVFNYSRAKWTNTPYRILTGDRKEGAASAFSGITYASYGHFANLSQEVIKRELLHYSYIFLDEYHTATAEVLTVIGKMAPDLAHYRIVCLSASPAGIVSEEGRKYKVENHLLKQGRSDGRAPKGHTLIGGYQVPMDVLSQNTLIFMATIEEVKQTSARLNDLGLNSKPHYSGLDVTQLEDFTRGSAYVVVSTNAIESGVTLCNLKNVIDLGTKIEPVVEFEDEAPYIKIALSRTDVTRQEVIQRKGRVGRTCEGMYFTTSRGVAKNSIVPTMSLLHAMLLSATDDMNIIKCLETANNKLALFTLNQDAMARLSVIAEYCKGKMTAIEVSALAHTDHPYPSLLYLNRVGGNHTVIPDANSVYDCNKVTNCTRASPNTQIYRVAVTAEEITNAEINNITFDPVGNNRTTTDMASAMRACIATNGALEYALIATVLGYGLHNWLLDRVIPYVEKKYDLDIVDTSEYLLHMKAPEYLPIARKSEPGPPDPGGRVDEENLDSGDLMRACSEYLKSVDWNAHLKSLREVSGRTYEYLEKAVKGGLQSKKTQSFMGILATLLKENKEEILADVCSSLHGLLHKEVARRLSPEFAGLLYILKYVAVGTRSLSSLGIMVGLDVLAAFITHKPRFSEDTQNTKDGRNQIIMIMTGAAVRFCMDNVRSIMEYKYIIKYIASISPIIVPMWNSIKPSSTEGAICLAAATYETFLCAIGEGDKDKLAAVSMSFLTEVMTTTPLGLGLGIMLGLGLVGAHHLISNSEAKRTLMVKLFIKDMTAQCATGELEKVPVSRLVRLMIAGIGVASNPTKLIYILYKMAQGHSANEAFEKTAGVSCTGLFLIELINIVSDATLGRKLINLSANGVYEWVCEKLGILLEVKSMLKELVLKTVNPFPLVCCSKRKPNEYLTVSEYHTKTVRCNCGFEVNYVLGTQDRRIPWTCRLSWCDMEGVDLSTDSYKLGTEHVSPVVSPPHPDTTILIQYKGVKLKYKKVSSDSYIIIATNRVEIDKDLVIDMLGCLNGSVMYDGKLVRGVEVKDDTVVRNEMLISDKFVHFHALSPGIIYKRRMWGGIHIEREELFYGGPHSMVDREKLAQSDASIDTFYNREENFCLIKPVPGTSRYCPASNPDEPIQRINGVDESGLIFDQHWGTVYCTHSNHIVLEEDDAPMGDTRQGRDILALVSSTLGTPSDSENGEDPVPTPSNTPPGTNSDPRPTEDVEEDLVSLTRELENKLPLMGTKSKGYPWNSILEQNLRSLTIAEGCAGIPLIKAIQGGHTIKELAEEEQLVEWVTEERANVTVLYSAKKEIPLAKELARHIASISEKDVVITRVDPNYNYDANTIDVSTHKKSHIGVPRLVVLEYWEGRNSIILDKTIKVHRQELVDSLAEFEDYSRLLKYGIIVEDGELRYTPTKLSNPTLRELKMVLAFLRDKDWKQPGEAEKIVENLELAYTKSPYNYPLMGRNIIKTSLEVVVSSACFDYIDHFTRASTVESTDRFICVGGERLIMDGVQDYLKLYWACHGGGSGTPQQRYLPGHNLKSIMEPSAYHNTVSYLSGTLTEEMPLARIRKARDFGYALEQWEENIIFRVGADLYEDIHLGEEYIDSLDALLFESEGLLCATDIRAAREYNRNCRAGDDHNLPSNGVIRAEPRRRTAVENLNRNEIYAWVANKGETDSAKLKWLVSEMEERYSKHKRVEYVHRTGHPISRIIMEGRIISTPLKLGAGGYLCEEGRGSPWEAVGALADASRMHLETKSFHMSRNELPPMSPRLTLEAPRTSFKHLYNVGKTKGRVLDRQEVVTYNKAVSNLCVEMGINLGKLPTVRADTSTDSFLSGIKEKMDKTPNAQDERCHEEMYQIWLSETSYKPGCFDEVDWETLTTGINRKGAAGMLEEYRDIGHIIETGESVVKEEIERIKRNKFVYYETAIPKNEKRDVLEDNLSGLYPDSKKPRCIQYPPALTRLAWTKVLYQWVKQKPLTIPGYEGKEPIMSVFEKVKKSFDKYEEPTIISFDTKAWDTQVTPRDLDLVARIQKYLYKKRNHKFIENITEAIKKVMVITCEGDVFVREGQRGSGQPDTSAGNSLLNSLTVKLACSRALGVGHTDIRHLLEVHVCGDDGFIITTKSVAKKLKSTLAMHLMSLGKPQKTLASGELPMTSVFEELEFCSHSPIRVTLGNKTRYMAGRDTASILGKLCTKLSSSGIRGTDEYERSICCSFLILYAWNPLIRRICLVLLSGKEAISVEERVGSLVFRIEGDPISAWDGVYGEKFETLKGVSNQTLSKYNMTMSLLNISNPNTAKKLRARVKELAKQGNVVARAEPSLKFGPEYVRGASSVIITGAWADAEEPLLKQHKGKDLRWFPRFAGSFKKYLLELLYKIAGVRE